jgi:hypothetical protein
MPEDEMKATRTLIARLPDGHLYTEKQVLRTNDRGGSAHERKLAKKNPPAPEWVRAERCIVRAGALDSTSVIQPGVEILPFGSEWMVDQAMENDAFAEAYRDFAIATVSEIDHQNADFARDPERGKIRKVKKVVLVYEEGMVEEL